MLEDYAPKIPDYALDMHTMKGKAMGRGLDHFRKEGAKLVPEPTEPRPVHRGSLQAVGDQAAGQVTARAGLDVNKPKRFASVHAGNDMSGVGRKPEVVSAGPNDAKLLTTSAFGTFRTSLMSEFSPQCAAKRVGYS